MIQTFHFFWLIFYEDRVLGAVWNIMSNLGYQEIWHIASYENKILVEMYPCMLSCCALCMLFCPYEIIE